MAHRPSPTGERAHRLLGFPLFIPRRHMTEMLETRVVWCQGVDAPTVSVVVPTKNEAANIEPLVEALAHALAGLPAKAIFVDDSDDDTSERIQIASVSMPRDLEIRLFEPTGTSAPAACRGRCSRPSPPRMPWVCVMDGDLQHPPRGHRPAPRRRLWRCRSRHRILRTVGIQHRSRRTVPQVCLHAVSTVRAPLFSRTLARVSDPMTGPSSWTSGHWTSVAFGRSRLQGAPRDHGEPPKLPRRGAARSRSALVTASGSKARHVAGHQIGSASWLPCASSQAGRSKWVYDVHGVNSVESDRALPELEKLPGCGLHPWRHRSAWKSARTAETAPEAVRVNLIRDVPTVSYRERTGFGNVEERGASEHHEVTVSPLVARSSFCARTWSSRSCAGGSSRAGLRLGPHRACFADGEDAFLVQPGRHRHRQDHDDAEGARRGNELRFISDGLVGVLVARWCRALLSFH